VFLREKYKNLSPALSYGGAAVVAVVAAFGLDSAVARMMVVPPGQPCKGMAGTLGEVFGGSGNGTTGLSVLGRIDKGYRGLSARAVEFFINYSITGATSVYVVACFDALFGRAS